MSYACKNRSLGAFFDHNCNHLIEIRYNNSFFFTSMLTLVIFYLHGTIFSGEWDWNPLLLFGAFMPLITCSDYLKPPNDVDFIRVALDASALIHPLLRRSRVGSNGYGGA